MTKSTKELIQLGDRLRSLRKTIGFTNYEQFAFTHNINRAQYGRYEKGHNITIRTLVKIIKIHDLTLTEFFAEGFGDEEE